MSATALVVRPGLMLHIIQNAPCFGEAIRTILRMGDMPVKEGIVIIRIEAAPGMVQGGRCDNSIRLKASMRFKVLTRL